MDEEIRDQPIEPGTRRKANMRVQFKVVLLVFLVLAGTLAAVIWKTRSLVFKDKLNFMADAAMKQMAPLKRLVSERLEEKRSELVKFATLRFHDANVAGKKMPRDFDVIALAQKNGSDWTPVWTEMGRTSPARNWPAGYEVTLLKSLPYSRVRDGETLWVRLSDPEGVPVYGILMAVEIEKSAAATSVAAPAAALPETTDYGMTERQVQRAILVGFSLVDPLADVAEDYIGSTTSVYVVDDKGYVASHVNKAYLGALFSEDPIVEEILKQRKTASSGTYEDLESRPVLGHFERIDGTNLYAVATSPLAAAHDFLGVISKAIFGAGVSLGVLGLVLAWFLGRSLEQARSAEAAVAETAVVAETQEKEASEENSEESRDLENERDPVEVTNELDDSFWNGFIEAAKEPVLAILGHVQLIKVKASENEAVRKHAESVERDARRAKEVLDRLREWKEQTSPAAIEETTDLRKLVAESFAEIESQLKAEGVELNLDLHDVPRLAIPADRMRAVLMKLVENAQEAMRARNPKRLDVKLDFVEGSIYLSVRDNGIGMTRDESERAFEPFFKAFASTNRMGLGLSFVRAIVAQARGECTLESVPGEGTTVRLSLPVSAAEIEAFRKEQAEKLTAAIAEKMVPMPEIESDGETETDVESEVAEAATEASPKIESAIGAIDFEDDDDDDAEDAFTSVSLGAIQKPSEQSAITEQPVFEATADGGETKFQVRIRSPKLRS